MAFGIQNSFYAPPMYGGGYGQGIIGNCTPMPPGMIPSFPGYGGGFPQMPGFPGSPGMGGFGDGFSQFPGQFSGQFPGQFPGVGGNYGMNGGLTSNSIDLNRDGHYSRGTDAVIGFDLNRDGKVTSKEMNQSRERLQAFGGNFDLNRDGKVSLCEKIKGSRYQHETRRLDTDRDGRLSTDELARGGARVAVDQNRDGRLTPNEQYSPYNFPTPGFGNGRINTLDPFSGSANVGNTASPWGGSPFGGGCGCGFPQMPPFPGSPAMGGFGGGFGGGYGF